MKSPILIEKAMSKQVQKKIGEVLMSFFPACIKSSCFFYVQTYVWAIAELELAVKFMCISTD